MPYFSHKEIERGIFRLSEVKGVSEYVVTGNDNALLIDTGYGHRNLVDYIKNNITSLPLIVINTHYHPDHSAGNLFFENVYIGRDDVPDLISKTDFEMIIEKLPAPLRGAVSLVFKKMDPSCCNYIPVSSGFIIELGGRSLKVREFHGHTRGSVLIEDDLTKTLFTGDACNTNTWLFTNPGQKIHEYADRVMNLADEYQYIENVLFSHSSDVFKPSFFSEYAEMLCSIDAEKVKKLKVRGFDGPVCFYSSCLPVYGKSGIVFFENQL